MESHRLVESSERRRSPCSLAHASPPCSPWLILGEEVKEALLQGYQAPKSSTLPMYYGDTPPCGKEYLTLGYVDRVKTIVSYNVL